MVPAMAVFALLRRSYREFMDDDCPTMAAALSYTTIFSLPPLLVLILLIAGAVFDPERVQNALQTQLGGLMGPSAATQIQTILEHAKRPEGGSLLVTLLGVAALLIGATGAFMQLQAGLNKAWEVKPDPKQGGIKQFIRKRLFSFGMILVIAFLLLVSLVVSALLSALGQFLQALLPAGISEGLLYVVDLAVSLAAIATMFALMFKVLPDAQIAWKDVWPGALVTALLFVAGKFLIGFYLGRSNPGEAFGAAGALALILAWIYYSSLILLFGAEFTEAFAERRGHRIRPEPGAMRVGEGDSVTPELAPAR
jgi:membrane protein